MKKNIFNQRIDFYGQSLAAYIVILIVFLVFYGTTDGGNFTIKLFSPIIILMVAIIIITAVMLIVATIKRKKIIIENETITFSSRIFTRTYAFDEISKVKINKSPSKVVKDDASFIRLSFYNKKKSIFIRSASFDNDKELLETFYTIRRTILQRQSKYATKKLK